MRKVGLVLAALAAGGCATHATKAVLQPPGRSPFSDARAAEIWSRADRTLSAVEAAELKDIALGDPDGAARLAAAWALGQATVEGPKPETYDEAPSLEHGAKPFYPQEAFDRGIQGTVLVDFLIDDQGNVAYAEVRESIPPLDAAAVATIRKWRFRPARMKGRPVPTLARSPVSFKRM